MNTNCVLYYKCPGSLGDLQLLLSIKNTISKRRRIKFRALRKRWMVKVGLSTRGIPPCYLLMILTNPHPPTYKHRQRNTKHTNSQYTAHKHTKRSETVEDKTRPSSVNECSLLYPVSVCLSLCSVDSYSCPLLSSTTQSYQGTLHTIQLPLLTLAMNLQVHSTYFHHGKVTTVG